MLLFNELHRRNKTTEDTFAVYPHSIAFKNVIALNYLIILKHTKVDHLPAKTSRVAILK